MTNERCMELLAERNDEIRAIWNTLPHGDGSLRTACERWLAQEWERDA